MRKRLFILLIAFAVLAAGRTGALALEGGAQYPGDIVYTLPVKAVIFSHKAHVEDKGLTCDNCHTKVFQLKAYAAQEEGDFKMEALYQGRYCGACHNGKAAFASNTQCARCHMGVSGYKDTESKGEIKVVSAKGPEPAMLFGAGEFMAEFRHEKHASLACNDCHSAVFAMKKGADKVSMGAIYEGKFCGACHNGKKAFAAYDCTKCHPNIGSLAKTGPKGVIAFGAADSLAEFSHAPHTKRFACAECHPKIFPMSKAKLSMTMDKINAGKLCGSCHNGKKSFNADDCGKCHPKMR